jgi:hypothetical protein
MKLRYEGEKRFRVLFPIDKTVEKGTEIETDSKDKQKRLKELGFKEVKPNKKKEGDE